MLSLQLHTADGSPTPDDQLRAVLDTLPALVWLANPDGVAVYHNRQWLEFTGLSQAQAVDGGWTAVVHPDDRSRLTECWRLMLASEGRGEVDARLQRSDGQYRWFLVRICRWSAAIAWSCSSSCST